MEKKNSNKYLKILINFGPSTWVLVEQQVHCQFYPFLTREELKLIRISK